MIGEFQKRQDHLINLDENIFSFNSNCTKSTLSNTGLLGGLTNKSKREFLKEVLSAKENFSVTLIFTVQKANFR